MSNKLRNAPSFLKAAVVLIYILLVMVITAASSGAPVNIDLSDETMMLTLKISQMVSVIVLFIVPSLVFANLLFEGKIKDLGLNRFAPVAFIGAAIALIFVAQPLINWLAYANGKMHLPSFMHETEEWMRRSENTLKVITEAFLADKSMGGLILNLFIVAFLAAVGEELFFRGVLQTTLKSVITGKHAAVWITAIIFSAVHMQFYGFIPRVLLGVVLGYLFQWSGSLWVPILVHFVNNGMAVLISYFYRPEELKEMESFNGDGTDIALLIGSLLFTTALLVYLSRKKPEDSSSHKPELQANQPT